MTTLILQKNFIEDLYIVSNDCPEYSSFESFLKEDLFGYELICDFNSIEEYELASKENPILELMMDKLISIEYNVDLEDEFDNDEFYEKIGQHSIFLTKKSKEECDLLVNKRGSLFFSVDNISIKWNKYRNTMHPLIMKVTKDLDFPDEQKLNSWSKIDDFCFPISNVIIFDKYILGNKTNQKLEDNLFPILIQILKRNPVVNPIQISIICEFTRDSNIKERHKLVEAFLKSQNISNFKINLFHHDSSFYPREFEGLHSRIIMTNYFQLRCDDSLNFFKRDGNVNHNTDVTIRFNLAKKNRSFFHKDLKDICTYISKIKNEPNCPNDLLKIMYYPDKCNPLFIA